MAGAIDLFAGTQSIHGANLWKVDKDPLNQLDGGIAGVIGKQAGLSGSSIITSFEAVLRAILGFGQADGPLGIGGEVLGTLLNVGTYFGNLEKFLGELNPLDPNFNPIQAGVDFITTVLKPTDLLAILVPHGGQSAGVSGFIPMENLALDLIESAVGGAQTLIDAILGGLGFPTGAGSVTDIQGLFTNLMSFLGNGSNGIDFLSGDFDLFGSASGFLQNVLTPAGALTSFTQIPAHLFGNFNIGGASTNLLPDGSFDLATTLSGLSLFNWSSAGRTKPGSAWTTGGGVLRQLLGVPIATAPGDVTALSAWTKWTGLSFGGTTPIQLAANAYDVNDNPISDPANRVVASITSPGSSSSGFPGADLNGWVQMAASYLAPAGTTHVRMALEVPSTVSAGNIGFDDATHALTTGIFDASILKNIANIPQLLTGSVAGFGGLTDLINTFQHMLDGLGSAYHPTGAVSGIDFSDLFGLVQGTTSSTFTAIEQSLINTLTLGIRVNKPISQGTNPTSEAMMSLGHFSSAGALTTTSLTAGNSIGQAFRAGEDAVKGFIEFMVSGSSVTNIFTNLYSVNPATGAKSLLWGSGNLASLVPGSAGFVRALIPGGSQPAIKAGDNLLMELVNNGSNPLSVVTKSTGIPNHPIEFPRNFATTRVLASTGGAAPAALTDAQVTYSGVVPYMNLGISNVPADYHSPETTPYSPHGSYTFTLPPWLSAGDFVDLIGVGAGGGGQGEQGYNLGQGGHHGVWNTRRLVVGTDIAPGDTINVTIGLGGPQQITFFVPGVAGTATTFSWTKPLVGTQTLTCAGGAGGSGAGFAYNGESPGNQTVNTVTYFGGGTVSPGNLGSAPGGGGGGAPPYLFPGGGADGAGWIVGSQS